MAICVRNIRTKTYQNLIIDFQVTVKNVTIFFETQCRYLTHYSLFTSNSSKT